MSNDETIHIGLVGCGNRGTGACRESLLTSGAVRLVAMADLFLERIETALKNLSKYEELRPKIDVPPERRFVGFDAVDRLLAAGVDLVLLATPPYFRPAHYAAAIRAGKHVFMEKPCCIDAPGYRSLLQTNQEARRRGLSVVVGLQRR
ncbi:MAG TPA: Gfo/Idh/MocA family oxidoreductase, partial [Thermoguttaceae bacterium]|nr:Gfo/Idh/MocA family oxidoreductase [Thermoguttaceae bacterium]